MAKKAVAVFSCTECGGQSNKWLGRCPDCNAWNTFIEETPAEPANARSISSGSPVSLATVDVDEYPRLSTTFPHLDRVLGGGIVASGVMLIAGEPGIGKSTLLLQVADRLARKGQVLYVSGEESPRQIALRARRLGTLSEGISLFGETSVERIVSEIERTRPVCAIIDSIQTLYSSANPSGAGSVGQVREAAGRLMTVSKQHGTPIFLIGHVTKEGSIAGPKTLEHIVDTVLYFEGDRFRNYRLIRAFKNRFGPVNEIAIYEMHDSGLEEVENPSAALIGQRSSAPGSAVVVAVEGTRPILIEVQALVSASHLSTPRRVAMGVDSNRLSLLLAVLEKRTGENFLAHDVYLNIAGGLDLDEPAIDLGIVAALVSSHKNRPIPPEVALFGEVGLLGEVRSVSLADLRAREAVALGFRTLLVPKANAAEIRNVDCRAVSTIEEFVPRLFG